MTKESTIQSNIIKHLKGRGAKVVNQHGGPMSEVGIPDLLVCYRGSFVAMEVKQKGAYLKPIQKVQLRRVIEAGGVAGMVRSIEDADKLLELADNRKEAWALGQVQRALDSRVITINECACVCGCGSKPGTHGERLCKRCRETDHHMDDKSRPGKRPVTDR